MFAYCGHLRDTETQVFGNLEVEPMNGTVRFSVSSCKISFSESLICQNVTWNQDHVKIQKKKPNEGEILYVLCAQSEKNKQTTVGSFLNPDQPKQK